jgi:hypothetical protein
MLVIRRVIGGERQFQYLEGVCRKERVARCQVPMDLKEN